MRVLVLSFFSLGGLLLVACRSHNPFGPGIRTDDPDAGTVIGRCTTVDGACVEYKEGDPGVLEEDCQDDGGLWSASTCSTFSDVGTCSSAESSSGESIEVLYDEDFCEFGETTPDEDCDSRGGSFIGDGCDGTTTDSTDSTDSTDGTDSTQTGEVIGSCSKDSGCINYFDGDSFELEDRCQGNGHSWSSSDCSTTSTLGTCTDASSTYGESVEIVYVSDYCSLHEESPDSNCSSYGGSYEGSLCETATGFLGSCDDPDAGVCREYLSGNQYELQEGCELDGSYWSESECSTSYYVGTCNSAQSTDGETVNIIYDTDYCDNSINEEPETHCLSRDGSYDGSYCP